VVNGVEGLHPATLQFKNVLLVLVGVKVMVPRQLAGSHVVLVLSVPIGAMVPAFATRDGEEAAVLVLGSKETEDFAVLLKFPPTVVVGQVTMNAMFWAALVLPLTNMGPAAAPE
jgi:hypothetical protein